MKASSSLTAPVLISLLISSGLIIVSVLADYATLLAAQNAPAQLSLISHMGQPTTMRFSTFTNSFAIPVGTKTFSNDAETTYVDTREKRVQATYVVSVEGFRLTDLPIEGEGSVVIKCGNFSDDTSEATECVVEVSGPRVTANGNKFQVTVPGGMFVVPVSTGCAESKSTGRSQEGGAGNRNRNHNGAVALTGRLTGNLAMINGGLVLGTLAIPLY
ncbi:hypothetical protein PM082_011611 [Marasmius tenuissimus]|nr:hypothetical protein PM082_011611 [Marasmius tenuissimus]